MTFFEWLRRVDFAEIDFMISTVEAEAAIAANKNPFDEITTEIAMQRIAQLIPGATFQRVPADA